MTGEEKSATRYLLLAKLNAKDALRALDPNPKDPAAQTILKVLDSIDEALKAVKNRGV